MPRRSPQLDVILVLVDRAVLDRDSNRTSILGLRSKWMLCNFYGKVLIEPTKVEHDSGSLRAMTQLVAVACEAEGLIDTIVAVEMTGIYHKPVYRAFRKAGFDTRIVHPFASNHYRCPLHPDEKTDDNDLEAIFHAAVKGYGLVKLRWCSSAERTRSSHFANSAMTVLFNAQILGCRGI